MTYWRVRQDGKASTIVLVIIIILVGEKFKEKLQSADHVFLRVEEAKKFVWTLTIFVAVVKEYETKQTRRL